MMKGKKIVFALVILAFIYGALKNYKYLPYKIELLGNYNKIGAHRLDSEYRLKSALKYFDILEFDLVFDENKKYFDITHPPVASIHLTLQKYLQNIPEAKYPFLWLDIKNLEVSNALEILEKLKIVLGKYNYPYHKILVETRYPDKLDKFNEAGFLTSYYLPYGLYKKKDKELKKQIEVIQEILEKQPNLGISANVNDYEIMLKYFPKRTKYTWALGRLYSNNFRATRKALKDSTVKIVLVSYVTKKGNR